MALFGYVVLKIYICAVFSNILTCLFCILIIFFKWSKLKNIWLIRIIKILLSLTNNNPNCHQTCHAPSNSSATSLSLFSPFDLYPPYLNYLHILNCVTQEVQPLTGEYTYGWNHQKTTFVLVMPVKDWDHPRWLTSHTDMYHSSPGFHPSLLCCGDFLTKCYWYFFLSNHCII